ncbi:MAG: B12-binding domain-containing radical SAM protein [Defluviitaleaceae bacterium]|nr:B12-binding domain-containing radical SAM protein [Defluviitaleaceae bacterium]
MYTFLFIVFTSEQTHITRFLNIAYLSTAVKKIPDVEVKVFIYSKTQFNEAINDTVSLCPDFIGLSLLQENFYLCLEFANTIKNVLPNSKIILGNVEATLNAEYIMNNYKSVDFIIKGEGENVLYDLLNRIIYREALTDCKGLVYRTKYGGMVNNGIVEAEVNIDLLDYPDRCFMKDKRSNFFTVMISRGCQGQCTFCDNNSMYPLKTMRIRSLSNVINEIKELYNEYNCRHIMFIDSIFCKGSNEYIEKFADEIKKLNFNLTFEINYNTELINEDSVKLFQKLKNVGLTLVYIGIESGNNDDLRLYGKKARVIDNIKAIRLLTEHNILYKYGFINFNPYSNLKRLNENIKFIENYGLPIQLFDFVKQIKIYGGTPLFKKMYRDGLIRNDSTKPVLNHDEYRYIDERIGTMQKYITLIYQELNINIDYIDVTEMYNRYEKFISINSSIFDTLSDFKEYMRDMSIDIMKTLLFAYDDLNPKIMSDIINLYKGQTDMKMNELKRTIRFITKSLYKINQYVITSEY